jgi:hypothetical protein
LNSKSTHHTHNKLVQVLIGTARKQVRVVSVPTPESASQRRSVLDDDQIETAIHVRIERSSDMPPAARSADSSPVTSFIELGNEVSPGHGLAVDGGVACCRRTSGNGSVDCPACLEEEWTSLKESLHPHEMEIATQVLTVVRDAEEQGVTKSHLRVCCNGWVL